MFDEPILRHERTSELGRLGELLAMELLERAGFRDIRDLNERRNFPFGDILAARDRNYLISVKTRCELRDCGRLNESYNLIKISDRANRRLQSEGKSMQQITEIMWQAVDRLADACRAVPAFVTVSVRPENGTFSAYFGEPLRHIRSIPMTVRSRATYQELAPVGTRDFRITTKLSNRKSD